MTTDPAIQYNVPVFDSFEDYINSDAVDVVAGYDLVEKASLVGVPFVITEATFRPGDYDESGAYVSCQCITAENAKIVFNDGSTGIRAQIISYCEAKGIFDADSGWFPPAVVTFSDTTDNAAPRPTVTVPTALLAKRGLRVSNYTYTDNAGKQKPATTYYLA